MATLHDLRISHCAVALQLAAQRPKKKGITMKISFYALVVVLAVPLFASAQRSAPPYESAPAPEKSQQSTTEQVKQTLTTRNLGLSGGWVHITGDQGLDGFDVSGELMVYSPAAIAFDYDGAWDTSRLGTFETTTVGLISVKSHLQDFLIGPRVYLRDIIGKKEKRKLHLFAPFVEAQFGESHLSSKVQAPGQNVNTSTSETAFAWELGGGNDFRLDSHWGARVKADFLRTHFADSGQSRLRFSIGLVYTVRRRNW
jgi:opacity protein-like surface antigen